jgi:hypothetical protein
MITIKIVMWIDVLTAMLVRLCSTKVGVKTNDHIIHKLQMAITLHAGPPTKILTKPHTKAAKRKGNFAQ